MDKSSASPYQKLTGRKGFSLFYSRLWKAVDHLLLVRSLGTTDEFKRFYYKDIQTITMMRTKRFAILNVLFIFALLIGIAMQFSPTADISVPGISTIVLSTILLTANLIKGPTCKTWIQTGINRQKIGCLRRIKTFRNFMAQVQFEIESVQGTFSLAEMDATNSTSAPAEPILASTSVPDVTEETAL